MGMKIYQKSLIQAAINKKLWMLPLGISGEWPLWYLRTTQSFRANNLRILIASGFHGEEQAGPLSLLKWIETFDPTLFRKIDLSFLPVVNPIAFHKKQRYNDLKQISNCGFCHPESGEQPSEEGVILLKHSQLLTLSARDGFLSLHEDITENKCYLYAFEHSTIPTIFTYTLRDELVKFFPIPLDNETVVSDATVTTEMKHNQASAIAEHGVVFKHCDGSFEDWLFHEGTKKCIVTETPGKYPLVKRIEANIAMINKFMELICKL